MSQTTPAIKKGCEKCTFSTLSGYCFCNIPHELPCTGEKITCDSRLAGLNSVVYCDCEKTTDIFENETSFVDPLGNVFEMDQNDFFVRVNESGTKVQFEH